MLSHESLRNRVHIQNDNPNILNYKEPVSNSVSAPVESTKNWKVEQFERTSLQLKHFQLR